MSITLSDSNSHVMTLAERLVNNCDDSPVASTALCTNTEFYSKKSPDKLEIAMSDEEKDIDASLEEKSEKIKLTATNVRSIIHVSMLQVAVSSPIGKRSIAIIIHMYVCMYVSMYVRKSLEF